MSEWLVADRIGGFAMGTPSGIRTRKYHGFAMSSPGRRETAFLADLEFSVGNQPLWPHRYAQGVIDHPDVVEACRQGFELNSDGAPSWSWEVDGGRVRYSVASHSLGVITLTWERIKSQASVSPPASGAEARALRLKIRPFFAFRSIHAVGGRPWAIEREGASGHFHVRALGSGGAKECFIRVSNGERSRHSTLAWRELPYWYRDFYYSEEVERGYPSSEDLFGAGYWETELRTKVEIRIAAEEKHLKRPHRPATQRRGGVWDFALEEPAGVCAGYPWFGEWGRDTFVSLPGIAAARAAAGEPEKTTYYWIEAALERWERWIFTDGMIPNVLEGPEGKPQWDSCDATLWWTHALASCWVMFLDRPEWGNRLKRRFQRPLDAAVKSIQDGKHRFLRVDARGALNVVAASEAQAYASWMDARSGGRAVTPRTGLLPEINALWFQVRCLQSLWRHGARPLDSGLRELARTVMDCREVHRPNEVFLFSLPLAPAFVLALSGAASGEASGELRDYAGETGFPDNLRGLVAPCGLRTLSPASEGFKSRCSGTQEERDLAYHQGTIWPWLGAHLEMARARGLAVPATHVAGFSGAQPIPGHIPEVFDAVAPHRWRGTPAQAWSLACFEELRDRIRRGSDERVRQLLRAAGNKRAPLK